MPEWSAKGWQNMPDNARFYHLAYVIAIAVYVIYAISIRRRMNSLNTQK